MSATQIILLERVEKLGQMGDVVNVKPGYARNFLFPQKKALRATKSNLAYFEGQRKALEAESDKQKAAAEKLAAKIAGAKAPLIRAASESGQLYGSVNSRDIAEQVAAATGETVTRNMVEINRNFKEIGLFPVDIVLHPEVKAEVIINIARTEEEAKIQAETGRALVADAAESEASVPAAADEETDAALEEALEEGALEAAKEKQIAEAEKEAEEEAKAAEREAKKAAKAEAAAAAEAEAETEEAPAEEASEEPAAEEASEEDKAE